MLANPMVPSAYVAMRGDYNNNSLFQLDSIIKSQTQIKAGIAVYSAQPVNNVITIADFGSSVGANSSTSVSHIIEQLEAAGKLSSKSQIRVIHSDLPRNNWSTLFEFVDSDPMSYAHRFDNVFTLASARGFYKQIMARNSLHFGYSNMSLQFLSELPAKITDHCFPNRSSDPELLKIFKTVAKKDVENFLKARSLELVPGGILVLNFLLVRFGNSTSDVTSDVDTFSDTFYLSAKEVVQRGLMTSEELLNFNYPVYFRTREEIVDKEIFEELGFEMISADSPEPSDNPFFQAFRQHGNVDRFANNYALFVTSICDSIFRAQLNADRSDQEKNQASVALWAAYRCQVKQNPEAFRYNLPALYLVLRKNQ